MKEIKPYLLNWIFNNAKKGAKPPKPVLPDGIKFGSTASTSVNFDWLVKVDTSNIVDCSSMFRGCTALTTIPLFDTSNCSNMNHVFHGCTNLTSIQAYNTSKVVTLGSAFQQCTSLVTAPNWDLSSAEIADYLFADCSNLENVFEYNTTKITTLAIAFRNCSKLTNESLNNILAMCSKATQYTATKTLKAIGLSQTQATTCQSLSNWNDFVAAGWSTGY